MHRAVHRPGDHGVARLRLAKTRNGAELASSRPNALASRFPLDALARLDEPVLIMPPDFQSVDSVGLPPTLTGFRMDGWTNIDLKSSDLPVQLGLQS